MLRNLLKTWQTLAPEEVRYDEHGLVWLKDPYTASLTIEPSSDGFLWPYEKSILQGCIQKCIEDRGWAWRIETGFIQNNRTWTAGVIPGGVFGNDREVVAEYEKPACLALLTAYLSALAAQRSPNPGAWQHFKGSKYKLICECEWEHFEGNSDFDAITEPYLLESSLAEGIELEVDLWLGGLNCEPWNYYTSSDNRNYGKLVFYKGSSGRWARKPEDFLSLVGSEHPEHQGKLRFTEVSHAT